MGNNEISIPIDALLKTENIWDHKLGNTTKIQIQETTIAKYRKKSRLMCWPSFPKTLDGVNSRAVLWNFYIPGSISIILSLIVLYLVLMFGFKTEQIVIVHKQQPTYYREFDSPDGLKLKGNELSLDEIQIYKKCDRLRVSMDPLKFVNEYCGNQLCGLDRGIVSLATTSLCSGTIVD